MKLERCRARFTVPCLLLFFFLSLFLFPFLKGRYTVISVGGCTVFIRRLGVLCAASTRSHQRKVQGRRCACKRCKRSHFRNLQGNEQLVFFRYYWNTHNLGYIIYWGGK